MQHLGDESHVHLLAGVELEGLLVQLAARHHLLGQRIGIGHDAQGAVGLLQAAQYLGAEYLVGGILLPVLDGTPEGGGEEQNFLIAQHLHQVVVEIARFLQVAQDEDVGPAPLPHQHGGEERGGRGTQSPAIDVMNGRVIQ